MNGADHIRRLEGLKSKRSFIEPFWRSAFDATYPLRGTLIGTQGITGSDAMSGAQSAAAKIYDSTLRDACGVLSATLQAGMTPANALWFDFSLDGADQAGKTWLSDLAKKVWSNIHECNYDTASYEALTDYVMAMACMYIEEGDPKEGKLYNFKNWALSSCYFADSTGKGIIDTCYRLYSLTAEQAVSEFTDKRFPLSEKVTKAAVDKPDTQFEFLHAIYPARNDRQIKFPIASEHVEISTKHLVRKSGYPELPFAVLRWLPVPDSVYSAGPADNGLPDHKTLNEMVKFVLMNADLAIAGMWGAIDDGTLNPGVVTVGPRKIIAMANKDSFFALNSGARFDVSSLVKGDLQGQIRRGMKADQLHPEKEGGDMTKYEVQTRVQMINRQLAPMFARLQPEWLNVMIRRCVGILLRSSINNEPIMPPPPESIQRKLTQIKYQSPLARSQKLEEIQAMDAYEERLMMAAKENITQPMDQYDIEEAYRLRAELMGVPQKLMRTPDVVKKIRDDRTAIIKQQQAELHNQELQTKAVPAVAKEMMDVKT